MKTIEIKGWIWAMPNTFGESVEYKFDSFDYEAAAKRNPDTNWGTYRKVREHRFAVEVPELDPRELILASLEAEREAVRAQFTLRINDINDRISKLQALPFEAPASEFDGSDGKIPF